MDTPESTDDYYAYMKACKKHFEASEYCDATNLDLLRKGLSGSFGVGNRGNSYFDVDPDDEDKLRFFRTDDKYKELLEYLHRLYQDGLIAKDAFSIENTKFYGRLPRGIYSSTVNQLPDVYNATNFIPIAALKGPDGDHAWHAASAPLNSIGQFVITDKCKHPVETARWMDYFYTKEGAQLFFLGVKGKSWKQTEHGPEYADKIRHPPKGVNQDEALRPYTTYAGGSYPGLITEGAFISAPATSKNAVKAARLLAPDSPKEIWTDFPHTRKENEKLESLSDDIEKYVDESYGRFVSGDTPLSNWNKYVNKIKQMGLDDYMKIQQDAYDRYRKHM